VEVPTCQHGACLVNGADGQFGLSRCAKLAHEHYVELASKRVSDDPGHRHRTAWHSENQRIFALVCHELFGK
jgi:hypothetical protein